MDHELPPSPAPLRFTRDEIDLLGRTADAMSAWMGKPVLAEVIDSAETGFEWVLFAVPLLPEQDPSEAVVVQVGGPGARVIGNRGGLAMVDGEHYLCEYLWAVQLSDLPGVRYIKVDQEGDEIAWVDNLREILPFDVVDTPAEDDDSEDDNGSGGGGDDTR